MALPRCRPGAVATPRRDQKRPQQSTERTNKSIVASSTCWWITLTRVTPTLQAKKTHLHQQRVLAQENPKRTPQTSSNPVLLLNSRESTSGCRAPRLLRPTRPPAPRAARRLGSARRRQGLADRGLRCAERVVQVGSREDVAPNMVENE